MLIRDIKGNNLPGNFVYGIGDNFLYPLSSTPLHFGCKELNPADPIYPAQCTIGKEMKGTGLYEIESKFGELRTTCYWDPHDPSDNSGGSSMSGAEVSNPINN